jgi:hypothetical protein
MTEQNTGGNTYNLPTDRLRITATYEAGKVGDVVPEGQPATIEIIYNEPLGKTPAEAAAFITSLIDALTATSLDVTTEVEVETDERETGEGQGDTVSAEVPS